MDEPCTSNRRDKVSGTPNAIRSQTTSLIGEPGYRPVRCSKYPIVAGPIDEYSAGVFQLTRHEQRAMTVVLTLLLVGWAVRTWRSASQPPPAVQLESKPL